MNTLRPLATSLAVAILLSVAVAGFFLSRTQVFATQPGQASTSDSSGTQTASDEKGVVVGFGYMDVEGGIAPLSIPAVGQVAEILVKENQKVEKGTKLVKLRSDRAAAQVATAKTALALAQLKLRQAKRSPANHALELEQQEQAVAGVAAELKAQHSQIKNLEKLVSDSLVTQDKLDVARDALGALDARLKAEQLKFEQLQLVDPEETIQLAAISVEAAQAQLDVAQTHLADHTLLSPEAGTVLRIEVRVGQMLSGNETTPALWFCPDRDRVIRTEIHQRFRSKISENSQVRVFTESSNELLGTGKVKRLAQWITHRRNLLDEPFQQNDVRTCECLVAPDDSVAKLPIGQRVRVVVYP